MVFVQDMLRRYSGKSPRSQSRLLTQPHWADSYERETCGRRLVSAVEMTNAQAAHDDVLQVWLWKNIVCLHLSLCSGSGAAWSCTRGRLPFASDHPGSAFDAGKRARRAGAHRCAQPLRAARTTGGG